MTSSIAAAVLYASWVRCGVRHSLELLWMRLAVMGLGPKPAWAQALPNEIRPSGGPGTHMDRFGMRALQGAVSSAVKRTSNRMVLLEAVVSAQASFLPSRRNGNAGKGPLP